MSATRTTSMRRVAAASMIGTTIEWYDYFLYGTAAGLVFNQVFFPELNSTAGTLAAFGTFAVGFVARPLGAIIFGHIGDRLGRKVSLLATLLMMAAGTFLIGVLPGYDTIGLWAPLALVVLRFIQGIGLGGEWGGAALMMVEHAPAHRRGFFGSLVGVGVPAGLLLSTLAFTAVNQLPDEQFLAWGWRIPFLLSIVMLAVGAFIRFSVEESPVFAEARDSGTLAKRPVMDMLRTERRQMLIAGGARFAPDIGFYVTSAFLVSYVVNNLGAERSLGLNAQLVGAATMLVSVPLFGALSDRLGRRPVYIFGAAVLSVLAFVFFPLVNTGNAAAIALVAIIGLGISHAAAVAPQASFYAELFGTRTRYSGATMGYQLSAPLAGGLAPIIATALVAGFNGASWPVVLYMVGASLLSVVAIAAAPETRGRSLADPPAAVVPAGGSVSEPAAAPVRARR
jgi:MHS family shikimate/dehydroshikimate transporter-like MFS transporter